VRFHSPLQILEQEPVDLPERELLLWSCATNYWFNQNVSALLVGGCQAPWYRDLESCGPGYVSVTSTSASSSTFHFACLGEVVVVKSFALVRFMLFLSHFRSVAFVNAHTNPGFQPYGCVSTTDKRFQYLTSPTAGVMVNYCTMGGLSAQLVPLSTCLERDCHFFLNAVVSQLVAVARMVSTKFNHALTKRTLFVLHYLPAAYWAAIARRWDCQVFRCRFPPPSLSSTCPTIGCLLRKLVGSIAFHRAS
jgi:hypothetical protein